jgi:hypothetical protein
MTPDEFYQDVQHSIELLQDITGATVYGHRAPAFSIDKRTPWALQILEGLGLLYDSSIVPTKNPLYGWLRNPTRTYAVLALEEGDQLIAYTVVRYMQQFGLKACMITELMSRPDRPDALEAVLVSAVRHTRSRGMDLCACSIHGNEQTSALLKKNGFMLLPKKFAPKEWYFGARINNDSVDGALVNDPQEWYLTFGDTGVI